MESQLNGRLVRVLVVEVMVDVSVVVVTVVELRLD